MRLLLDTHAFLWFVQGSTTLSNKARILIEDPANQPLLSMASLREMAIKLSLGKLSFTQSFETFVPQQMRANGIALLDIRLRHVASVANLPFHHRDPFDRLLIAQAIVEQLPLLSADPAFATYSMIKCLW